MTSDLSAQAFSGLALQSLITAEGEVRLLLARRPAGAPAPGEVVLRVEAAPINPSDLGLLLGPADPASGRAEGADEDRRFVATVPERALAALKARLGQALPAGNEGAGVIVAVGEGADPQLIGRTAAAVGGGMYAQYRRVRLSDCLVFEAGTPPRDAASSFVNPLTALGMTETMRLEGHGGLVHTAAASNLGRMLNRICRADAVPLVNVVRSQEQARLLREEGALHVVDTSAASFEEDLAVAIESTGATLAFDAIGGGALASTILQTMEKVLSARLDSFSRYGSSTHKQVYIYGGLDPSPTQLRRSFGMAWGVGGWLLWPFLQRVGPEAAERLKARVRAEITSTFRSGYAGELSLAEALRPECVLAYARKTTGEKFLIAPWKDA